MAYGLTVNHLKSKLFALNLKEDFVEAASSFLSCSIGNFPFNFLGASIVIDPIRKKAWILIVKKLRNRLSLWKARKMSMGWKLVTINSILSNIPIYQLYSYKAPRVVEKEMIKI